MRFRSTLFIAVGVIGVALMSGAAQAGPPGWECSYASLPFVRTRSKIYYACTGKSLTDILKDADKAIGGASLAAFAELEQTFEGA